METLIDSLLSDFEHGKVSRRHLIQILAATTAAAGSIAPVAAAEAKPNGFKAVSVNHISYQTADYGRTRDFYAELLGMKVSNDDGKQCFLSFGDSFLVLRNSRQPDKKPLVDHVCYSLEDWDEKHVEAELTRRKLAPRVDNGSTGRSFHVKDPDGYDLQLASPTARP